MSNNLDALKERLERALVQKIPEPRIIMPTGNIQKNNTSFEVYVPNLSTPDSAAAS
ncbi:MAG: hypothetical protein K2X81_26350 [Candidatus Obscuribacterales bacterium]|nr:hypothetical protein [Candidatus Obscuribacterales bacterium]